MTNGKPKKVGGTPNRLVSRLKHTGAGSPNILVVVGCKTGQRIAEKGGYIMIHIYIYRNLEVDNSGWVSKPAHSLGVDRVPSTLSNSAEPSLGMRRNVSSKRRWNPIIAMSSRKIFENQWVPC